MADQFDAAWKLLPGYLGQHVLLSVCALVLGLLLSLPLAVAAAPQPNRTNTQFSVCRPEKM